MSCYEGFASMYDALMADAPYEVWAAYIDGALGEWFGGSRQILVLDLACGTANLTLRLAEKGYDLIGVDSSEEMLAEASRKAYEQSKKILFLAQDMRELNLYGTVDAAISVCDGMNYILTTEELLTVFKRVRLFLNSGGIFIFDMNTEYKFKELLNNQIFEGTGENDEAYEWQNNYNAQTKINEYRVTFYSLKGGTPFDEIHQQRAYPPTQICKLLREAGFLSVTMRDDYTNNPVTDESARVVYIAAG
ncbi:MAG: class I SAM-dependent methyltransferase [Defluviitaleaceae bacterium]|nr:class I SAM-dependent methyltransferase [Defluviitaleaceae bacterium]